MDERNSWIASSIDSLVDQLERHLSLFDLIAIGVGGTIGSGLFVLCGIIVQTYAGPATALSWVVSGFAACISGCCYAEPRVNICLRLRLHGGSSCSSCSSLGYSCILLLLAGVKESKAATNVIAVTKLLIVFYMIVGGFFLLQTNNWDPFIPPQFGAAGVLRGATASFFGYIGYVALG